VLHFLADVQTSRLPSLVPAKARALGIPLWPILTHWLRDISEVGIFLVSFSLCFRRLPWAAPWAVGQLSGLPQLPMYFNQS